MSSAPRRAVRPNDNGGRLSVLLLLVALGVWEGLSRAGVVSPTFFPSPTSVLGTLAGMMLSGTMLEHLRMTMTRVLAGLTLGGAAGLMLGLAMGWSERLRSVADPIVGALHPIPKLALLPLFMVIFGLGETSKIIVVAAAAFFPMLLNAMAGVRQISAVHFDVARNYGASRWQMFTRVVVPGSVPMVLTGLRIAANVAFLSTIAVEMIGAQSGLGAQIWLSWQVLRIDLLFATLTVIAALGVGISVALRWIARRGAPWLSDREMVI